MIIINKYFGIKVILKLYECKISFLDSFKLVAYHSFLGKSLPHLMIKKISYTIYINLCSDIGIIFHAFSSTTKNEINKATKIGISSEITADKNTFFNLYNIFAKYKSLPVITLNDLNKYGESLVLSKAIKNNKTLVMHAYIFDKSTRIVTLLYSMTNLEISMDEKKLISYANRFLHYNDLLYFKQLNFETYDFGGLSMDKDDLKRIGIASFKRSFGGTIVPSKNFYSMPYYILLKIRSLLNSCYFLKGSAINQDKK